MFRPVMIEGSPHFDGGIFDCAGTMALPLPPRGASETEGGERTSLLVLNLMCDASQVPSSAIPPGFPDDTYLLTVVLEGIPAVSPFDMQETGPIAHAHALQGLAAALASDEHLLVERGPRSFMCCVDCSEVDV